MKLTANINNMKNQMASDFAYVKERFSTFIVELEAMAVDHKNLGIEVIKSESDFSVDAKFAGTHVRYQLFPAYDDKFRIVGKIYVTRQSHRLVDNAELLGVVTFDRVGTTDIEDSGPEDLLLLGYCTRELVWHFSHVAIGMSVQLPKAEAGQK